MILTKVTSLCEVQAPEGAKGKMVVWADKKEVCVILHITQWPEKPGKFIIFLPWGKIYGRVKKAQTQIPAKDATTGLLMKGNVREFIQRIETQKRKEG